MQYALPQDVVDAYEGDIAAASTRVSYLLDTVSARLTATIPALPRWIDEGRVDAQLARSVVVEAVLRQLRNPDGTVTKSQSVDGFSVSASYGRNVPTVGLFEAAELALLRPASSPSGPIRMRPWPLMHP